MQETETPRTPLWRMSDEQLRFIADDILTEWNRRKMAETILINRHQQESNPTAFSVKVSEVQA